MRGRKLEAMIRKAAVELAELGIARIHQWPMHQIAQQTTVKCPNCNSAHSGWKPLHTKKTGYDFFGYSLDGRFIAIEAKECSRNRLPVNVQQGHGVKVHQVDALAEVERNGGIGMVVWLRHEEVTIVRGEKIEPREKSISRKDLFWSPANDLTYCLRAELPSLAGTHVAVPR
jgi:penicillin-binding protein-related factor A (putative recombinase)